MEFLHVKLENLPVCCSAKIVENCWPYMTSFLHFAPQKIVRFVLNNFASCVVLACVTRFFSGVPKTDMSDFLAILESAILSCVCVSFAVHEWPKVWTCSFPKDCKPKAKAQHYWEWAKLLTTCDQNNSSEHGLEMMQQIATRVEKS